VVPGVAIAASLSALHSYVAVVMEGGPVRDGVDEAGFAAAVQRWAATMPSTTVANVTTAVNKVFEAVGLMLDVKLGSNGSLSQQLEPLMQTLKVVESETVAQLSGVVFRVCDRNQDSVVTLEEFDRFLGIWAPLDQEWTQPTAMCRAASVVELACRFILVDDSDSDSDSDVASTSGSADDSLATESKPYGTQCSSRATRLPPVRSSTRRIAPRLSGLFTAVNDVLQLAIDYIRRGAAAPVELAFLSALNTVFDAEGLGGNSDGETTWNELLTVLSAVMRPPEDSEASTPSLLRGRST
jgi:hypothetical protein